MAQLTGRIRSSSKIMSGSSDWMGDRAVYCARLESVCAFTGTRGSNPRPSASLQLRLVVLSVMLASAVSATAQSAQDPVAGVDPAVVAEREFENGNVDKALAVLDEAEKRGVRNFRTLDVRGCVLMEQGKLDEAIQAFQAAREADPAEYNRVHLGDALQRQKKWAEARNAYRAATKETNILHTSERLRFGIFMTHLGSKDEEGARQALAGIPFPTASGAYYFAQAAWAFAHGENREAKKWMSRAEDIYKPRQTAWFARHLYDFGWLKSKPLLVVD